MSSVIQIFDKSGNYLTEIEATISRWYKLNEFGKATFELATSDQKCIEQYLEFGNLVYITHPKLPAWGGMIDTPREWRHGSVISSVYSAEYLLKTRITQRSQTLAGPYGTIFQTMLEELFDSSSFNVIRAGSIFGGGPSVKRVYNFAPLYDEIRNLAEESGNDFEIEPNIDSNGRLYFAAHWHKRKEFETNYTLYEDLNLELPAVFLREQGTIANKLRIFGDGATFTTRPLGRVQDQESIDRFGVRFLAKSVSGSGADEVQDAAEAMIKVYAWPRKTFELTVADDPLNIKKNFENCRIGNILNVSFHSVGFSGSGFGVESKVRILQMYYDENKNTLKLIIDQDQESE